MYIIYIYYGCSSKCKVLIHTPGPHAIHTPWSIPVIHTLSEDMIHTYDPYRTPDPYLSNCKSWACIVFWVRGQGQLLDLYDLIRRHDVAPELTRQTFETRGYVHKVSNPLPVPDPACSLLHAIATIKDFFMFVLVWWLAICSLKYTWGCEGLWAPQYPPNQPRVIHDWFPFQQKD